MIKRYSVYDMATIKEGSDGSYVKYAEVNAKYKLLLARVKALEEAIEEHKDLLTNGTKVKPLGVDHCLWSALDK